MSTRCMKRRRVLSGVIASMLLLVSQTVSAQGFDLQQFNPMPNQSDNFFATSSAEVAPHLSWSASLLFNYANDPLVRRADDGSRLESLLAHQGTAHALFSIGLVDRLELGIDVPLILLHSGASNIGAPINPAEGGLGIGDLRLVPKVQLFSTRESAGANGVAFALLLDAHLPTGRSEFLQGGDFRIGPRLAVDAVLGRPKIGANLGYLYRSDKPLENLAVRDTVSWNVAVEFPVLEELSLTGEVFGRMTPRAEQIRQVESPTELLLGGKYRFQDLIFIGGAGAGLLSGYGTPDFRAFAGVSWAAAQPVEEEEIEPSLEPEPEPECYAHTVADSCTEIPEAFCEDEVLVSFSAACEGGECSYPAAQVRCAEGTICGEENGRAACVLAPECTGDGDCQDGPSASCYENVLTTYAGRCEDGSCVYDAVETACPENHQCGLVAGRPACVEGVDLVEVDEEREQIQIHEIVRFAVNSDEIDRRSYELLNQVASVLEANPQIKRVRIEGHTDSSGSRAYNLRLSQRRAESVRSYLIAQGVAASRLTAVGLGPDQPVDDNATRAGRAANRRVEFHIEERD